MKVFIRWLPAIMIMSIIFYLSSRQGTALAPTYFWNYLANKGAHIFWYALLCLSFYYATRNIFWSIFLTTAYGVTDEIHQMYVPTRSGRISDVAIDFAAACLMGLRIYYYDKLPCLIRPVIEKISKGPDGKDNN